MKTINKITLHNVRAVVDLSDIAGLKRWAKNMVEVTDPFMFNWREIFNEHYKKFPNIDDESKESERSYDTTMSKADKVASEMVMKVVQEFLKYLGDDER